MEVQNHKLVLKDSGGYRLRGEVVDVGHEIDADGRLNLTFRIYDWIDFGTYRAVFTTPRGTLQGEYEVWSSTLESNENIIVIGQFRHDKKGIAAEAPVIAM